MSSIIMCKLLLIADQVVLRFINDSPRVNGSTITADIYYNQPIRHLQCALDFHYKIVSEMTLLLLTHW